MEVEKKRVKLLLDKERTIFEDLLLYEEAPDDEDMVLIEIIIDGEKFISKSENYFSALQALRIIIEKKNIQIMCNGAAINVYASPMQMSMGSGRKAYKLFMGQQAKNSDVVDVFDCYEEMEFVNTEEQVKYYTNWIESIMKK
jgi:hypothetical protein